MASSTTADPLFFAGPAVEPVGSRAWSTATPRQREAYFTRLAQHLLNEFDRQLGLGIGANGQRMPKRKHERADGADGAVLSPHRERSRTRRLLTASSTPKGVRIFWRAAGRRSWTTILGYHRDGLVPGAPERNVFGVTRAGTARAVAKARQEWADRHPFDRLTPPPASPPPAFAVPVAPRRPPPTAPPIAAAGRLSKEAREYAERYPNVARFLQPGPSAR